MCCGGVAFRSSFGPPRYRSMAAPRTGPWFSADRRDRSASTPSHDLRFSCVSKRPRSPVPSGLPRRTSTPDSVALVNRDARVLMPRFRKWILPPEARPDGDERCVNEASRAQSVLGNLQAHLHTPEIGMDWLLLARSSQTDAYVSQCWP